MVLPLGQPDNRLVRRTKKGAIVNFKESHLYTNYCIKLVLSREQGRLASALQIVLMNNQRLTPDVPFQTSLLN